MTEEQIKMIEQEQLVVALRQIFTDDSTQAPMLIKRIPFICNDVRGIHETQKEIKDLIYTIDKKYSKIIEANEKRHVSQDQFWPVKTLVYGFVAIILTGVATALIALILIKR